MNHRELRAQLEEDPPEETYGGEEIRVLDADGFIHDIDHVSWDPDDKCFYVHTKFMPEEAAPSV